VKKTDDLVLGRASDVDRAVIREDAVDGLPLYHDHAERELLGYIRS